MEAPQTSDLERRLDLLEARLDRLEGRAENTSEEAPAMRPALAHLFRSEPSR